MISTIENSTVLSDGKRKYVIDKKYTIALIGTGYVGLMFARFASCSVCRMLYNMFV